MSPSNKIIPNLNIIKVKGDSPFFGMKIKDNNIELHIPETYRMASEDDINIRKDIVDYLRTLTLVRTPSKEKGNYNDKSSNYNDFALYSYLWLIRDYFNNGIYRNREKTLKKNQSGRINWKRTLQQTPFVSNGNIVFNDFIVDVSEERNNIIVELHKAALKKSLTYVGWLFNLKPNIIQSNLDLNKNLNMYVYTLDQLISKTFDDVKKLRLQHIKNVITGVDLGDAEVKSFGVTKYSAVYEKMIDKIFSSLASENEKKKFDPTGDMYLLNTSGQYEQNDMSCLRPDTILIKNKIVYILDSKMYRYGVTHDGTDLPAIDSTQKQITYADFIKNNKKKFKKEYPIDHIFNAFLVPYDMENNPFKFNSKNFIEYVGYTKPRWRNGKEDYIYVYIFLVDMTSVIKKWNNISHTNEIDEIIKYIGDAKAHRISNPIP